MINVQYDIACEKENYKREIFDFKKYAVMILNYAKYVITSIALIVNNNDNFDKLSIANFILLDEKNVIN